MSSATRASPISEADAAGFCERAGLAPYVSQACALLNESFEVATAPRLCVEEDPESGAQFLEICIRVRGTVDDVLDAYDRFTRQWVAQVPDAARERIRFGYSIVA